MVQRLYPLELKKFPVSDKAFARVLSYMMECQALVID